MKKLTTLMTALALTSASFAVLADGQNDAYKGDKKCHHKTMGEHHKNLNPAERQAKMEKRINFKVERMTKKLNLTENQQNKLKNILIKKSEKKRELYMGTKQQIRGILNPEQVQKMEQFKRS